MIPRIAQRGHSFKGAGAYYLHDKKAQTSERVIWTETRNLPTGDPEKALRIMACTDQHSDELKQQNGISTAGREQQAGNVYSYSLAWSPEQRPDREEMLAAAYATLEHLGLSEHQAVIVAHGDTDHSHVHVIANLVDPNTGKVASIRQDRRTLSAWALDYEKEHGTVYCKEREENARKREDGQLTHYQDERLQDAPDITTLYRQCDTGKAFVAALEEAGYTIAQGDKGRLVIVDNAGKVQNLVRQIDGAKRKDIEQKLADISLADLPSASEVIARQRDTQESLAPAENAPAVAQIEEPATSAPVVYDTAGDEHMERAQAHAMRYEEATRQEMSAALYEAAAQEYAAPTHAVSGFAQHMERAARHMHRIVEWIRSKPREFWESWCRKSHHRVQRQVERQAEIER